jgi:HAD superfamily hydrolase (TIGR01509 family)
MPPRLLICDLDGTLVDSEPIGTKVLAAALQRLGAPVTVPEAEHLFTGLSLPQCYALAGEKWGIAIPDGFHEQLQKDTFAMLRRDLVAMPNAAAALARIGLPKCIASSGEPAKIELQLDITGLRRFFGDNLFSARMVKNAKPAPDLFLLAAERMGVAPADCIVVEDSTPGISAALAAGMTVYGYRAPAQPGIIPLADWSGFPALLQATERA